MDRTVSIVRGAAADYWLRVILKAISLGVISGCRHLSDVDRMGMDEALMKTRGWESFPVLSSITRVMEGFDFRNRVELSEVQKEVRQKIWNKKWVGSTWDFDS